MKVFLKKNLGYIIPIIISLLPYELKYRLMAYVVLWLIYGTYCIWFIHRAQFLGKNKSPVAAEDHKAKKP